MDMQVTGKLQSAEQLHLFADVMHAAPNVALPQQVKQASDIKEGSSPLRSARILARLSLALQEGGYEAARFVSTPLGTTSVVVSGYEITAVDSNWLLLSHRMDSQTVEELTPLEIAVMQVTEADTYRRMLLQQGFTVAQGENHGDLLVEICAPD